MDNKIKVSEQDYLELIKMIRADKEIGRGSCSYIDECCNDEELREEIDRAREKYSRTDYRWILAELRRQSRWYNNYTEEKQREADYLFGY